MTAKTKSFISVLAIGFLDNFGLSIVFILFAPLLLNPEYGFFSETLSVGTKNTLLGVLLGTFPFFQFFGAPFWGDVGDRWGRKRALVFTVVGTVVGHLLTAASIFLQSYLCLLLSRGIAGFFSGNASICMATVSDLSSDAPSKARNFGILTVFWGLGFILAMFVGGYLSDPNVAFFFGPTLPFYAAAALTFLGVLIVLAYFHETHPPQLHLHFDWIKSIREIKAALRTAQLRPFLFTLWVWSMGWFFNFMWFTPVSIESFSIDQEQITWLLAILGLFWTTGGAVLNPFLVKRFSSHRLALFSVLIVACLVFLSSIAKTFPLFVLFFLPSSFASPVSLSNLFNLVSEAAPNDVQGKAMGFCQSFLSLSGILVPLGGGVLANLSVRLIYPTSAALLFLSCLCLFLLQKKR